MTVRLPDFIIVGAMKAGTTTAYRWLEAHPGTALPPVKEPDFFCRDDYFRRGMAWYSGLFDLAPADQVTGEASVKYSAPEFADVAADRIAAALPDVKLIALLRDPVERLRSEYRFSRQRGWERSGFVAAVTRPGNPYVAKSCYSRCLAPYLGRFPRDQILLLRAEDLRPDGSAWRDLLAFLGLAPANPPDTVYNETDALPQMRAIAGTLDRRRIRNAIAHLPAPVRRLGRKLITDPRPAAAAQRRADSESVVPPEVLDVLRVDAAVLHATAGFDTTRWPSTS